MRNGLTVSQMKELLTEDKRRYSEMVVENEFRPKGERLNNLQIAEQMGYTDRALRDWKKDPIVIEYMRYLTNSERDSYYPVVMRQLHRAIEGGNNGEPSIRAIELWLKASNMLVDQKYTVTETVHRAPLTRKEVSDSLGELDDIINGD